MTEVQVGPQGRIVIPASLRRALTLRPGDKLTARIDEGRLVLEKREQVLARLRARYQSIPKDVSMVDELIAERRAEAHRDSEG